MATYKRPKDAYDLMRRLRASGLTPVQRGVLLAQYSYADRDGTNSRPSEKTLAEDLGISERQVGKHRKALREAGWLIERERGVNLGAGGDSRASLYAVVIPTATGTIVPVAHPSSDPQPEPRTPKAQLATGTIVPPTGTTGDRRFSDRIGQPDGCSGGRDLKGKEAAVSSGSSPEIAGQIKVEDLRPSPPLARSSGPPSLPTCVGCGNEVLADDPHSRGPSTGGYLHQWCPNRQGANF